MTESGRQREFPGFADSCPWPARPTHRKSASRRGRVLTLPAEPVWKRFDRLKVLA